MSPRPATRLATVADAPRLTELMVTMHDTISGPHPRGSWVRACRDETTDRLANDPAFFCYVAEHPGAGVVAFVTAEVRRRFPGPTLPSARYGSALTGGTDAGYRGKGYFRSCFSATLEHLAELGCDRVSIFAAREPEGFFRGFGFQRHEGWPVPMNCYLDGNEQKGVS